MTKKLRQKFKYLGNEKDFMVTQKVFLTIIDPTEAGFFECNMTPAAGEHRQRKLNFYLLLRFMQNLKMQDEQCYA